MTPAEHPTHTDPTHAPERDQGTFALVEAEGTAASATDEATDKATDKATDTATDTATNKATNKATDTATNDATTEDDATEDPIAAHRPPLPVRVIRSRRRRRTLEAKIVEGAIEVRIPAHLSADEADRQVAGLVERLQRRARVDPIDLRRRTHRLAERHGLPRPASIRFVDNQRSRWGSCTPADGHIRLSSRLADYPAWVLDYVIVHELAHLAVPDHSAAFHALVDRYPRAERARGYLHAKADGR